MNPTTITADDSTVTARLWDVHDGLGLVLTTGTARTDPNVGVRWDFRPWAQFIAGDAGTPTAHLELGWGRVAGLRSDAILRCLPAPSDGLPLGSVEVLGAADLRRARVALEDRVVIELAVIVGVEQGPNGLSNLTPVGATALEELRRLVNGLTSARTA